MPWHSNTTRALQMDSEPEPIGCAGVGCPSAVGTWPLHHVRRSDGALCRLCSSCLLLEYRPLYCCCCFLLLGPEPPAHFDDGDPILAPPVPVATCHNCNEAVAHRYCLQSDDDTFVCPACVAATEGRPFSFSPAAAADAPLDMRAARIILLAARISLAVLKKAAATARATAERLYAEAKVEKERAYRALAIAFSVDTELPSTNRHVEPPPPPMLEPPEDVASESSAANMGMVMDPPENLTPPASDLANINMAPSENLPSEGSLVNMAMGLDLNAPPPPPPSPDAHTTNNIGMGSITAMAMAAAEAARLSNPPPRTLKLFRDDKNSADDDDGDM
ncbi:uncharacterized protein LOC121053245 [Oryza brachyantha]|uniref:uncharacterized protein LOC121053245 n=1 Tax=Oryza brachyantha TaxID=4533 RepID=UPI001ADD2D91|nr:uncharacterized protein LOC121053245 [Oryza brachyantha]